MAPNPVTMTPEEQAEFLHTPGQTLQLATMGANGFPHLSAMWYAFVDGHLYFNSYTASQKGRNIERDARVSCMVESGKWYGELKGVVLQGRVAPVTDEAELRKVSRVLIERYPLPNDKVTVDQLLELTLRNDKRQLYRLEVEHGYSWDHSKAAAKQRRKDEGKSVYG